ncbi:unnamed protein product [Calicophoron daubneyi]|uniref:Tyrosyl-DNA phosphodiesterase 1 n=1 Tax=Calicophoron daubneyi TaxID=300641 RepID=A0AAV2TN13_CALDB
MEALTTILRAHIRYPFGSHHTKMMFLKYRDGLKIVIHTANMIPDDWNLRTQGIWISPKLPLATDASNTDSATKFRSDLITYLEGYGAGATRLRTWIDDLKLYDFREIKVYLVASVSGSHGGPALHQFGHLRLKMLLQSRKFNPPPSWLTVGQFSSIGSLGAQPNKWLTTEFAGSLAGRGSCGELRLVFPCVEDVRNSLEGYLAGGCLPYTQFTADKQPWLREFLCRWQAGGHSRAAPHIKSYTRISPDNKLAAWFLLTSANLSKAAWGNLIKSRTQLMIRSYELGVLFLPECFQTGASCFPLSSLTSANANSEMGHLPGDCTLADEIPAFPIPYNIPLSPYRKTDEPWIVDKPHTAPDTHGRIWKP